MFCGWPIDYAGCDSEPFVLGDDPTAEQIKEAEDRAKLEDMAAHLLWEWTGRIFGLCPVRVRPCREYCADTHRTTYLDGPGGYLQGSGFLPVLLDGKWYNLGCGDCNKRKCVCPSTRPTFSVLLPGPVDHIERVVIGGEELDPGAYRLQGRALIRTDGEGWPPCQDLMLPENDPDAWYVEYVKGIDVPTGGRIAAGILAEQLYKALCGDNDCQLPQRVQSITRQGVSMAVLDSFEDVQEGRTGIWAVDAWVASINAPQTRPARVYSPDMR